MPLYYILTYANSMVIANNEAQARAKWENGEEFGLEANAEYVIAITPTMRFQKRLNTETRY
jgi:hypothetical protein